MSGVFNYSYDSSGNPIQRTDASLRGETVTYDANGNPVAYFNGLGQRLDAAYDAYGNRSAYLAASLLFATATYNEYSLPTSLVNGLGHIYTYTYDCAPALTRVTDPAAQQTNYTRDAFSNMTQQSDVLSRLTNYTYNANGNETLMTSPAGDALSTAYNPENLIASVNNGAGAVSYDYDPYSRLRTETLPSAAITYNRDSRGRATSIVTTGANAGTHTNTYDAANRLLSATDKFGRTVSYTYDIRGRRTSLTDHDGVVTSYTYDAGGKLRRIQTGADFAEFTYDAAGRRSQLLYSNGVRANYTYDSRDRLLTHTWLSPANTVLRSWAFTYDAASRPIQVALNDGTMTRAFDSLGRLTSENIASALWGNHNFAWSYDAAGNRLDSGASYGADHRQLSHDGSNFSYTAAGNQSTSGANSFTYDAYNRMNGVGYTLFTFDHLGRRNSALFFDSREVSFDGENTLAIYAGTNTYRFTHSLTIDDLLFVRNHGATRFFITDHQGSVVGLTDSAGAMTAQFAYNAWGQFVFRSVFNVNLGSPDWQPFFFQGRELETFLNLYHMRAREYSPIRGRFLQKDPERGDELLPMSRHPYMFALNAPTTFVDPMGREAEVYAALITRNPLAKGGGFAAGFSIGFSGSTLSFIGHFLGEFLKDPTADLRVTMQNAATLAVSDITKVVSDWEKRIGKKKKRTTSVGEGLSEGAPEGISTFSSYIQGLIP
jgi:RHS repeat-associated protein